MFSFYFSFYFNFVVLFLNLIHVHGSMCGFAYNPFIFFLFHFFNIGQIFLFLFRPACIIFSFDRDTLNVHMSIHNMTFGHLIKIGKRCLISSKNEEKSFPETISLFYFILYHSEWRNVKSRMHVDMRYNTQKNYLTYQLPEKKKEIEYNRYKSKVKFIKHAD